MMKLIRSIQICCLLICSSHILTKAQPYESVFGKDTTQWNVVYHIPDLFPTLIFRSYGDTLINEQKYVPVYMGYYYTPLELYGYFKEDTNVGKLWFRGLDGQEELFMDLSLAKNDSFYFGLREPLLYTVDTVYYKSGKKYISFQTNYPILFIEGIGPFNMFFSIQVGHPDFAQIRCKEKDNVLVFMNSDSGTCLDTITGVNNILNESIKVYPNPVSGKLFIQPTSNIDEGFSLEMYSVKGELVKTECLEGGSNLHRIDVSSLKSGVYVLRLTSASGKYDEVVIIKE